jgi:hypothetical protein
MSANPNRENRLTWPVTWRSASKGLLWSLVALLVIVLLASAALWWLGSGRHDDTAMAVAQGLRQWRVLLGLGNVLGIGLIAWSWEPLVRFAAKRALERARNQPQASTKEQAIEGFTQGLIQLRHPVIALLCLVMGLGVLRLWN